jgi:malic enzyme
MFFAAADALAAQATESDLEQGRVFPVAARMREVASAVAVAVATAAYEQGHARSIAKRRTNVFPWIDQDRRIAEPLSSMCLTAIDLHQYSAP